MTVQVASPVAGPVTSTQTQTYRSVVVAGVGNILEWYDFTVYGFVAVIMAKHFFPAASDHVALLVSLATFGVAFLARPLGAIAFGYIGDRRGRKFVLLLSMLLMAGASFVIGILPTYASIGIWAPILLVVARLAQGLSAGGEFGSAAAFLVEWAPPNRRGLFGSFHQVGASGGLLLGSVLISVLSLVMTPTALEEWGWRIPFLLGGLLAIVALYMRRNVEETPKFRAPHEVSSDEPILKPLLQIIGIIALWTVSVFATMVYMPTFTQKFAGLARADALWATTIALCVTVATIPVAGYLSDRVGRKPLIFTSTIAFIALTIPCFKILTSGASFATIAFIQAVFAFFSAVIAGPSPATISEMFSTAQRTTWVSIGGAIAVVVFGGFAPFIATMLIDYLGTPIAPSYYVVACAIITGLTALTLPETAKRPLR